MWSWLTLPKDPHFSMHLICLLCLLKWLFVRNQSYNARIQLAVLDYNAHLDHGQAKNKEGNVIYNRKFQKQTKKWDATPSLVSKKYNRFIERN